MLEEAGDLARDLSVAVPPRVEVTLITEVLLVEDRIHQL